MADLQGFNANNVEPARDFEPIPAGKYMAMITASEMKANKAGTGKIPGVDLPDHGRRVPQQAAMGPVQPGKPQRHGHEDRAGRVVLRFAERWAS